MTLSMRLTGQFILPALDTRWFDLVCPGRKLCLDIDYRCTSRGAGVVSILSQ